MAATRRGARTSAGASRLPVTSSCEVLLVERHAFARARRFLSYTPMRTRAGPRLGRCQRRALCRAPGDPRPLCRPGHLPRRNHPVSKPAGPRADSPGADAAGRGARLSGGHRPRSGPGRKTEPKSLRRPHRVGERTDLARLCDRAAPATRGDRGSGPFSRDGARRRKPAHAGYFEHGGSRPGQDPRSGGCLDRCAETRGCGGRMAARLGRPST